MYKYMKKVDERGETELMLKMLCLAVLIAVEKLPTEATLEDADRYYDKIGDCNYCPFADKCLACELER